MKHSILLASATLLAMFMHAENYTLGDLVYSLDASTHTASVVSPSTTFSGGRIVIPDHVVVADVDYPVTDIKNSAFFNCFELTSITIPRNIIYIGRRAFSGCSGLTSVVWDAENCASPTSWDDSPFIACENITTITFGEGVESIPDYLCFAWNNLTSLSLSSSIKDIGRAAFYGCSELTSITIPENVTNIKAETFAWCRNLSSITIPQSVDTIYSAFEGCTNLSAVHIENLSAWCNVKFIGDSLMNPLSCAHHLYISGEEITDLVIPDSVTRIGDYAFLGCTGITSAIIPASVTSIGRDAFGGCENLKTVFNDSPLNISEGSNGYGYIASYADKVYNGIPMGDFVIHNDTIVTGYIGNEEHMTIPSNVTCIDEKAFIECTTISSVTFPNTLKSIGSRAFCGCSKLSSITIPEGVTSIGRLAFATCPCLETITVEDLNHRYDSRNNCNAIIESASNTLIIGCKNTTIPNNVTNIGEDAFADCYELASITIPENVTSLGFEAFKDCSGLTQITCEAYRPPFCDTRTFVRVDKSIPLYVPSGSETFYWTAAGWSEFTNILPIASASIEDSNTVPECKSHKELIHGQMYITRDGNTYTVLGTKVK